MENQNQKSIPPTTSSALLNACKVTTVNARLLALWVTLNPWLDGLQVDYVLPAFAQIKFKCSAKAELFSRFGADGWVVVYDSSPQRTVGGVTLILKGEA